MKHTRSGYYDIEIDIEEALTSGGLISEIMYLKDLKQRKLFLADDVTQPIISELAKNILQYNCEDTDIPPEERKPILLYITCNGGEVDAGFELIDVILNSKTPVYTVNLGYAYSMGFLINLAGHKRYATRFAKFLMHDGSSIIYNSGTKAQDQMEFNKKVEARMKDYIIAKSKLTSEEYDSKLRVEWYLFSDEAKEKGFTDYIIGEDCDIDEIV